MENNVENTKKKGFIRFVPNIITCIRIAGVISLIFLSVTDQPLAFYLVYGFSGLTDILDGTIARRTHTTSYFGSVLDSVADILLLGVMGYKFIPLCVGKLHFANWILIFVAVAFHLCAYIVCYFKFHRMSSLHTYANKLMSAMIFLFPFVLIGWIEQLYLSYAYVGNVVAILSGLECLMIHCISYEYDSRNQSLYLYFRNKKNNKNE